MSRHDRIQKCLTYWENKFSFSPMGWLVMSGKWAMEIYFLVHVLKHI